MEQTPRPDGHPRPDVQPSPENVAGAPRWTRRRILTAGLAAVGIAGIATVAGVELISHGVLPGKQELDQLDGACAVDVPTLRFAPEGPSRSGSFYSPARRRRVGYTIAWPPEHGPGAALPLVVMLHGYGGNHTNAVAGMRPDQAVALEVDGHLLPPMALVTVDGGGGYWNPHPGDDPMRMVMGELIPMCQALNLGAPPKGIATMGISMGGYGALLLAEKYPRRIAAAAAISPAIWTNYEEARAANAVRTHRRPTSQPPTPSPTPARWLRRRSGSPRAVTTPSNPAYAPWPPRCRAAQ